MAGQDTNIGNYGLFIPTTNVWDIQQLQSIDIDPQLKELLVRLYQNINNISLAINNKDTGYYFQTEFVNGQSYFSNPALNSTTARSPIQRQVFRTVVNFGALPNTTTKSVAHNVNISTVIPSTYSFTRIYGASSKPDQTSFIPLPYASSTLVNNIELSVTNTDVVVTTAADYSAYTTTYLVIEYIKS